MIARANIDGNGTKVGLFVFDTDVNMATTIHMNSTSSREELLVKVRSLPYNVSTKPLSLYKALDQFEVMFSMQDNGTRSSVPDLAFLFLTPDVYVGTAIEKAERLRKANIHVYITAVGFMNDTLLRQIAYLPDNYVLHVDTFFTLLFMAPVMHKSDKCSKSLSLLFSFHEDEFIM